MLNYVALQKQALYADCHSAECHTAECHCTEKIYQNNLRRKTKVFPRHLIFQKRLPNEILFKFGYIFILALGTQSLLNQNFICFIARVV
jgi:hypothetical protein